MSASSMGGKQARLVAGAFIGSAAAALFSLGIGLNSGSSDAEPVLRPSVPSGSQIPPLSGREISAPRSSGSPAPSSTEPAEPTTTTTTTEAPTSAPETTPPPPPPATNPPAPRPAPSSPQRPAPPPGRPDPSSPPSTSSPSPPSWDDDCYWEDYWDEWVCFGDR